MHIQMHDGWEVWVLNSWPVGPKHVLEDCLGAHRAPK